MFLVALLACVGSENGLLGATDSALPGGEDAGGKLREASELGSVDRSPDAPPARDEDDPDAEAFFAEGTLHEIHLELPDESRAALGIDPRAWAPATFRHGRREWPVMVHLKGTTTFRPLSGKAAFKVDFHADDPDARFHGLKRLTLNSMLQDSSMLHEHVAYWLLSRRGVPAPRHTFARVFVNDTYYGLYGAVEGLDEQWLDRTFPDDDDGNLYESNLADFVPGDAHKFVLKEESETIPPFDELEALSQSIADAPSGGLVDALGAGFDFDALMAEWAIDLVSGNVDGYTRMKNNFWAYHAPSGPWYLVPWGFDQSFQWARSVDPGHGMQGHLAGACGGDATCRDRLYAEIRDLMEDWKGGELARMVSDESGLIQAECRTDPRAELPCDIGHVLAFVLDRPRTVAEEIGSE